MTNGAYTIPKINSPPNTTTAASAIGACGGNFAVPQYGNPIGWAVVPSPCQNLGQFGFRSNLPGGANFVMCDGSVKFMKSTMNTIVAAAWEAEISMRSSASIRIDPAP